VDITSLGIERIACRQELKRLRAECPQVVLDYLKRKLVREFNLEISSASLATFACGSCNELCPITAKKTLSFEEFDLDLLRRPLLALQCHLSCTDYPRPSQSESAKFIRVCPLHCEIFNPFFSHTFAGPVHHCYPCRKCHLA
jgi:hypothetical protein